MSIISQQRKGGSALATHGRKGVRSGEKRRIVGVFVSTFVLAVLFSLLSDSVLRTTTVLLAGLVLVVIVLIGILADVIGLAAAAADPAPLNAMAAKKTPGARQALRLVRNAPRVGTVFNDLIGDISGTVSGAAAASIVFRVATGHPELDVGLTTVLMVAIVAAFTVGGKAIGKTVAIDRADEIMVQAGRFAWWMETRFGVVLFREQAAKRNDRRKVKTT